LRSPSQSAPIARAAAMATIAAIIERMVFIGTRIITAHALPR
jgi:hypothetical protein